MNIEIRTDNNIHGDERLIEYVSAELKNEFQRYAEKVMHFEVHLSDVNGAKGGDDNKRCMIEARMKGLNPIAVSNNAEKLDIAISGAIDKLKRSIEHAYAKQDHTRDGKPNFSESSE